MEEQLLKEDTATQRLIRNFEKLFAQFYIDAYFAGSARYKKLQNKINRKKEKLIPWYLPGYKVLTGF